MSVTVLGCCGSYPGVGQACSGYLVRSADTTVWLDAGSGTLANLQRHVALDAVDAIVLSHEHPDHWIDLTGFYVASKYYFGLAHVPVYAPSGLRDHAYYSDRPLDWTTVADGDQVTIGPFDVTFSRTDHGPETLAARFDSDGRSFAYTADTGPGWSLEALGRDIDLALSEATYLRDLEGRAHHLSARQAGERARDAGVDRLVLTHVQPGVDPEEVVREAAESFGAPAEAALVDKEYLV